jgi:CubicO group peptidase (beta-lactamase class C family)
MVCADLAVAAEPSRVGSIFARLAAGNSPGVAVLVRKDDKTMVQRGYGVRDLRTLAPINTRTDFRLASFSKQFTAMAAMLLVHDGKLRYDDRLTQIFPDFPEYGRAITVRHLLTHTSGLPDYEELMGGGPWTETRQIRDDEVLALLKQQLEAAANSEIRGGDELGVQQLGICGARSDRGEGVGRSVRRLSTPTHLSAPAHGSHAGVRQGQE